MRLRQAAFFADENIHPAVVDFLHRQRLDTLSISDAGLRGADDEQILEFCRQTNRIVLTHDRDFGRLTIARLKLPAGIVYLRPGHIDPQFTMVSLMQLLQHNPDLEQPFIIVVEHHATATHIRLRQWRL